MACKLHCHFYVFAVFYANLLSFAFCQNSVSVYLVFIGGKHRKRLFPLVNKSATKSVKCLILSQPQNFFKLMFPSILSSIRISWLFLNDLLFFNNIKKIVFGTITPTYFSSFFAPLLRSKLINVWDCGFYNW